MLSLVAIVGEDEENSTVENVDTVLTLETLPENLMEHFIIKVLVLQDFCSLSQISKSINAKTNRPELWQLINVSQRKIKQEGLPKLFIIDKFKLVQRINLSHMHFTTEELISNLRAVAASSVVELDLENVRVDQAPVELLAKIVSQLKKINLSYSYPTKEQCVALLRMLQACVPPTNDWKKYQSLRGLPVDMLIRAFGKINQMTHINLAFCKNLREVPDDVLVKGLSNLTHINLSWCDLSRQQHVAVVDMCASSASLEDLSMWGTNFAAVSPQTLGQAVGRLSKILIQKCDLSRDQWSEVLDACASSSTLTHVSMSANDLTNVSPQALGQAVGHLAKLNLGVCDLSTDQSISVLDACAASAILKQVCMGFNDLKEVPAEQLAKAVGNLQIVDLGYTNLTTEQCVAILKKCKTSSSKLNDIDLRDADLRQVSPQLLEEALPNLQRMCLRHAKMTIEQKIGIIKTSLVTSSVTVFMDINASEIARLPDGLYDQVRGTGRVIF